MDFSDALRELRNGKQLRQHYWPDYIYSLQGWHLYLTCGNVKQEVNFFHKSAVLGLDWEIVK